jgi:hypothetical protein
MEHKPQLTAAQVRHLRPQYAANPQAMLYEFCAFFSFGESREKLWKMVMIFMNSKDADSLSNLDRGDYLFFYQLMEALLEAVFLLNEQQQGVPPATEEEVITSLPAAEVNESFRLLYYELKTRRGN